MEEVEDGAGVRGQYGLLHELAFPVQHGSGDGALVDIEADILDAVHQGVPFVRLGLLLRTAAIDYSKGAPFYNACPRSRAFRDLGDYDVEVVVASGRDWRAHYPSDR